MIMILEPEGGDYASAFIKEHQREFSFTLPNRKVLVENLRVRGRANASIQSIKKKSISSEIALLPDTPTISRGHKSLRVYFEGGWRDAPLHLLKECSPGSTFIGPAMIYDETQMIVVQPGATAKILQSHVVIDLASKKLTHLMCELDEEPLAEDPIQLSVMSNRFMGIAEQMGLTLQKTSVSVNIKERLDFSCALFGVSIPVHDRGSMLLTIFRPMVVW
jgi:5-oxoprolinase (ATP-hydrolysing)